MTKAKDTFLRLLALLQFTPQKSQSIAATNLQAKLDKQGLNESLHTIEVSLESLSTLFYPQLKHTFQDLEHFSTNKIMHWRQRTQALVKSKVLQSTLIGPSFWDNVSTALPVHKQLQITNLGHSEAAVKAIRTHPTGLGAEH